MWHLRSSRGDCGFLRAWAVWPVVSQLAHFTYLAFRGSVAGRPAGLPCPPRLSPRQLPAAAPGIVLRSPPRCIAPTRRLSCYRAQMQAGCPRSPRPGCSLGSCGHLLRNARATAQCPIPPCFSSSYVLPQLVPEDLVIANAVYGTSNAARNVLREHPQRYDDLGPVGHDVAVALVILCRYALPILQVWDHICQPL